MAEILSTNHTSFTVSDLDRSLGFFEQVLGFEVTSKAPRAPDVIERVTGVEGAEVMIAYVRGPGHSIELIEFTGPEKRHTLRPRACDLGFCHIAYDVRGLDELIDQAKAFDVVPEGEVITVDQGPNAGARLVYLRDPDGVTFELIEKPL
ncbi:MAG: VOC family protein [Arenicellales bacterium]